MDDLILIDKLKKGQRLQTDGSRTVQEAQDK